MGEVIQAGDHVIIYSSRDQVDSIIISRGSQFQSKYGLYKHESMLGVPYGSKFASSNGKGFVYLLKPTPELWTLALPHRTQILYLPDIAFITSYLDIKAGSKVIEAGTGSGSFSHSIARSVGAKGKVYSYEFHEERFLKAQAEFTSHGLSSVIDLSHRNVCKEGFAVVDTVDSVFLDLPSPWEALPHALLSLRKDRPSRICSFSPCIEQVLRTVTSLTALGFSDITTFEALTRTQELVPLLGGGGTVAEAVERIRKVEVKKGVRREAQIEEARRKREGRKRGREEVEDAGEGEAEGEGEGEEEGEGKGKETGKRMRKEDAEGEGVRSGVEMAVDVSADVTASNSPSPTPVALPTPRLEKVTTTTAPPPPPSATGAPPLRKSKVMTIKTGPQTRGHTSYLTFATLLPSASAGVGAGVKDGNENGSGIAGVKEVEKEKEGGEENDGGEEEFPLAEGEEEELAKLDL